MVALKDQPVISIGVPEESVMTTLNE